MAGFKGSQFAALAALALMLSGNAVAQPPALPPLPSVPQPAPPVAIPDLPLAPLPPLPTINPPAAQAPRTLPPLPSGRTPAFTIKHNTPVKELLPVAPSVTPVRGPLLTDDLAKVPEVEFEARPEKSDGKPAEKMAHQIAKINHLNAHGTDAFMAALVKSRPDLAGLPVAMGDDCRTSAERSEQFTQAVATVRQALSNGVTLTKTGQFIVSGSVNSDAGLQGNIPAQPFWPAFAKLCEEQDAKRSKTDKAVAEHVTVARVAALMQMLAPESPELRAGLVKYLTAVPHAEATRALARLAIFSAEDDIRSAAIDALKARREKDYTDVLVKGLRYPLPAVAKRAADAIAGTGRSDLIAELVAVLEEDDARMPRPKKDSKEVVVRELVKVNHHRNCMLCHAPAGVQPSWVIAAAVPVQDKPLTSPSQGYGQSGSSGSTVRIDVTYLRQDFSVMQAVADAHPWPELQRFDFLVRERALTTDEATTYREKLTPKGAGVLSPYHKAALSALRELTGKDTAPTAAAWRKLLDMPAKLSNENR